MQTGNDNTALCTVSGENKRADFTLKDKSGVGVIIDYLKD